MMKTITAIESQKAQKGRLNLFLDGAFAFSISIHVAATVGLQEGQKLSSTEIENLKNAELLHRSLNSALRFLSPRPRSEAEIKTRLRRHGYDVDIIQQVIDKLKEQKLVDDTAFAQFWRENRENFKPRSRRLIEVELKQKGVNAEIIAEATDMVDDEIGAYKAAQRKAISLTGLDYLSFRKRLGTFLRQRGFPYEVINMTIERVWQEQGNTQPDLQSCGTERGF
jgi:regulatory protein